MRARFAYISSLGTTAILVAAALLMLLVVGAIVAFRGGPGVASGEGVKSVPLAPRSSDTSAVKIAGAPTRRVVRSAPARRPSARKPVSTKGLVKIPGSGGSDVVPGLVLVPPPVPPAPPAVAPQPGPDAVSAPADAPAAPSQPGTPLPPQSPTVPLPVPLPDPALTPPPLPIGAPGPVPVPGTGEIETVVGEVMSSTPPPLPGIDGPVQVPLGLGR